MLLSRNTTEGSVVSQQVLILKKDSIPGHLKQGVRLDPDWIDLQLARKWKQKCLDEHGTICRNPLKVSPVRPFWVVDIESECIIPGRDCAAFVALSYRWGNHSWPAVDRQMLTKLRKPGSLSTAHVAPIVRHATRLTLALGERYLWVDLWEHIDEKTYWSFQGLSVASNIRILEIRTERGGPKVGELYLHNISQLAPFLLASDDCIKTGPGQPVELVAIYRSLVREAFSQSPDVISERYRVL